MAIIRKPETERSGDLFLKSFHGLVFWTLFLVYLFSFNIRIEIYELELQLSKESRFM
jgi:hypothetical protein